MGSTVAIEIRDVVKRYGSLVALDRVRARIRAGRITGILGPNGAGKTTLLRILVGIYPPDEGTIIYFGTPFRPDVLYRIGYMPEERGLYRRATLWEHAMFIARLRGLRESEARQSVTRALQTFHLWDRRHQPVEKLSHGMQQRFQLLLTDLHHPDVIILDEPFAGLDPQNVELVMDWMRTQRARGVTVLLSTHEMELAEQLCEDVVLIHRGTVIWQGALTELRRQHGQGLYELEFSEDFDPHVLSMHVSVTPIARHNTRWIVRGPSDRPWTAWARVIHEQTHGKLLGIRPYTPPLREIFLSMTGRK